MTIDTNSPLPRRVLRTSAVTLGLALGSLAAPALASAPDTWEDPDNGSVLGILLFVVGVPILVILVLTLLTYLPTMMRRQSSEPALAFRERPEWFGGPRRGVEAAPAVSGEQESEKGGAGARW